MATRKRIYLKPYWAEIDKILKIMYYSSDAMSFEEVVYYSKMLDIIKYKLINLTEQNFTKSKALKECIDFIFEFQDVLYKIKQQKDPRYIFISKIEEMSSVRHTLKFLFLAIKLDLVSFFFEELLLQAKIKDLQTEVLKLENRDWQQYIKTLEKIFIEEPKIEYN